jgi:hypothetical protein
MTKLGPFGTENWVFLFTLGDEVNCNFTLPNAQYVRGEVIVARLGTKETLTC